MRPPAPAPGKLKAPPGPSGPFGGAGGIPDEPSPRKPPRTSTQQSITIPLHRFGCPNVSNGYPKIANRVFAPMSLEACWPSVSRLPSVPRLLEPAIHEAARAPRRVVVLANAKTIGWAIYAAGFTIWLFGYLSAGHAPLFDWKAATPWWISNFVPNLEAELGLALMFASMIPTLPWARILPFAALLVFAAVTLAWWWFLAWLIWHVI